MAELAAIANKNGGIIETKTAAQHGISKAMLYKLCKAEKIHRIVKGQYVLPEDMQDELLSISHRSGKIIFSHETALFLHGISDRTPFEMCIRDRVEGLMRIIIFIGYLMAVSCMKDIKRTFMYHGAEHKTCLLYTSRCV